MRALASPDAPGHAFATEFLGSLAQEALPAAAAPIGPAFDDEGKLMPGVVDPQGSLEEQQAQLQARLIQQGMNPQQAEQLAATHYDEVREFQDVFLNAQPQPVLLADASGWSPQVRSARQTIDGIEERISRGDLRGGEVGQAMGDAYQAYLQLAGNAEQAGVKPSVDDERAASRLIGLIADLGEVAKQQSVELTPEQARLVRLAKGVEAQRYLPDIYGAAATGGILGLRQSQRGLTRPTGTPGGRPMGEPKAVPRNARADMKRGFARENEAGETLANSGYRVEYLPESKIEGKRNPDLLVEGRVFDVYSPDAGTSSRSIISHMAAKVGDRQTERVVLNLADNPVSRHELRAAFDAMNTGIKEVIVIGPDKLIYRLP